MTTYTRDQIATRLQKHAGLVGIDETPSAAAQEEAEELVEAGMGTLNMLGIQVWNGNDNSIPHEYLMPVIEWLIPILHRNHGMIDFTASLQQQRAAEQRLREMSMIGPSGTTLEAEYF